MLDLGENNVAPITICYVSSWKTYCDIVSLTLLLASKFREELQFTSITKHSYYLILRNWLSHIMYKFLGLKTFMEIITVFSRSTENMYYLSFQDFTTLVSTKNIIWKIFSNKTTVAFTLNLAKVCKVGCECSTYACLAFGQIFAVLKNLNP